MSEPIDIIAERRLFFVRRHDKKNHLRVFVIVNDEMYEVTSVVARTIGRKRPNDKGFIAVKGTGHNHCQHVADAYNAATGKNVAYTDLG